MNTTFYLKVLLSQVGIIILSASLGAAAFIAICVLVLFFLHRSSFSSNLKKYQTTYTTSKNLLNTTCNAMITRLATLAKSGEGFKKLHDIRSEQYSFVADQISNELTKEFSQYDYMIKNKNFKEAISQDRICRNKLDEFTSKVRKLNDDLTSDLKEDEDTRNASLDVKKRYRDLKDFYKLHINELSKITTFNEYFESMDSLFRKFDTNLDNAQYSKCLAIIPKAEKEIEKIEPILSKLPTIETLIDKVIPNKIKQLTDDYEKMKREQYVLTYIKAESIIKEVSSGLKILQDKVLSFNIDGVEETLNEYQKKLTDLQVILDSEKEAKSFYIKYRKDYIQESFDVEKNYKNVQHKIEKNVKTFKLSQSKIDDVNNKKNEMDAILKYHRKLENYDTNPIDEPYTVIVKGMKFLKKELDIITQTIKDYDEYIRTLNAKSEHCYAQLWKYYNALKEAEIIVRFKINLEVLTEQLMLTFEQLYKTITLIEEELMNTPIDIEKIETIYNGFQTNCEAVIDEVHQKEVQCKNAEEVIAKGNYYRIDFADCRKDLDEAEKFFNEGEFSKAEEKAKAVLKTYSNQEINI